MNNIVVVFTINNKFVTPTYITIQSLFEYAGEDTVYECLVLSNDITTSNIEILKKLTDNTRHTIKIIDVDDSIIYAPKVSYTWPKVVYWRIHLCNILNDYDKVIFSDVDVLFQGDLTEAWNSDIESCEIAAVAAEKNNEEMLMHQYYQENKHEFMYWAGFMVMNLKYMRESQWVEQCNRNLKKYESKLKMCDLEIINITAENIRRLPLRYVFLQSLYDAVDLEDADDYIFLKSIYSEEDIKSEKESIVIIHYAGKQGKPWLRKNVPEYYRRYLEELPLKLKLQNNYQRFCLRIRNILRFFLKIIINIKGNIMT